MSKTDDKTTGEHRSLDGLVRCGNCQHFEQISKYNRPPLGKCTYPLEAPIGMQIGIRTLFDNEGEKCNFHSPNDQVQPEKTRN